MKVDIWNTEGTRVHKDVESTFANVFMDLPEGDVEWAIENHGRCDVIGFIAVPSGETLKRADWEK